VSTDTEYNSTVTENTGISGSLLTLTSTGTAVWNNGNTFTTTNNSNCLAFVSSNSYTSCNSEYENCSSVNYISSQLSPSDFALLDMKYVQGYDYCEIGKEFNLTSSTVSNRVNYIKTKLKKSASEIIMD